MAKAAVKKAAPKAVSNRPSLKMSAFDPGVLKDAVKNTGAQSKSVYMVPIEKIKVAPGFNLRLTDTLAYRQALAQLKDSILILGFYNTKPLAGYIGKDEDGESCIFVTDGHRRLEAAKLAMAEGASDLERLPMMLKPASTTSMDLTVALARENATMQLSVLEQAVQVARMRAAEMEPTEIAKQLGITVRYVGDLTALIQAPKALRDAVAADRISGSAAIKMISQAQGDKKALEEKLEATIAKAEAKGKTRATASDATSSNSVIGVKMMTDRRTVELSPGQRVAFENIEPFLPLFGDSDWYSMTETAGEVEIAEPIIIKVSIKRPKKEVEAAEAADDDNLQLDLQPTPPRKRKKQAEVEQEVADDDDFSTDGDGNSVADLQRLGIADPAAGL